MTIKNNGFLLDKQILKKVLMFKKIILKYKMKILKNLGAVSIKKHHDL